MYLNCQSYTLFDDGNKNACFGKSFYYILLYAVLRY